MRSTFRLGMWRSVLLIVLAAGVTGCDPYGSYGPTGEALSLATARLRIAEVGTPWQGLINPTGGTTPYAYHVALSALPTGIAFQGLPLEVSFSGTPLQAGAYPFTLTVTDAVGDTISGDFTILVVDAGQLDLSGTWQYTMTVTEVNGDCGEVVGNSNTHTLTITQTGSDLVFAGFFGDPQSQLAGQVHVSATHDAVVEGVYPEGTGTLEGRHLLDVFSPSEMAGTEYWRWSGPEGECIDSRAHIEALRIGP